ncbi:hypothetical protein NDU88_002772 [Pleurodeles waltl]|uniref:Uncharacterized protein n=1 Tax=Pleurodeles waltl TaxID=8319 RepID=A0AAV7TLN1_PLEWA|nr:hypothetical protein NDU88_002772 [Pleurodeles waltl]
MQCSRLSSNPAQDSSDWRWPRGVSREGDCLPHCFDDASTSLENPDIRVPSGTKSEDGLHAAVEEKDAEEPGSEENGGNTEDQEKKADDDRRNGNSVVPREAADPGRKGRNGGTSTDRHAPGGTWLTKVSVKTLQIDESVQLCELVGYLLVEKLEDPKSWEEISEKRIWDLSPPNL